MLTAILEKLDLTLWLVCSNEESVEITWLRFDSSRVCFLDLAMAPLALRYLGAGPPGIGPPELVSGTSIKPRKSWVAFDSVTAVAIGPENI